LPRNKKQQELPRNKKQLELLLKKKQLELLLKKLQDLRKRELLKSKKWKQRELPLKNRRQQESR